MISESDTDDLISRAKIMIYNDNCDSWAMQFMNETGLKFTTALVFREICRYAQHNRRKGLGVGRLPQSLLDGYPIDLEILISVGLLRRHGTGYDMTFEGERYTNKYGPLR